MQVVVIPVVVDALGMDSSELERGMEQFDIVGKIDNIQNTVLLRSPE